MSNHFCLECGTRMVWREIEEMQREQCPQCGWIYYRHLKLGVGAVVVSEGKLLLLKRNFDPWKGHWNLPAGYVEVNETPEMAVVREVREETGLEFQIEDLLGTYFFDDDPRGNGLLVAFSGAVAGGKLVDTFENHAGRFFSLDEIPEPLCGSAHDRVIAAYIQRIGQ